MINKRLIPFIIFCLIVLVGCSSSDDVYVPITDDDIVEEVSPVVLDLEVAPYEKLSDYNMFEGTLKDLEPVYGVLPYEPSTSLFTDYAHKKRFVWMPKDVSATFNGSDNVLDFPTGTILVKNFYYDNAEPQNNRKIIETRLLIKKETEWVFATYAWNNEQTEAFLNMNGSNVPVSWNENGVQKNVNYRIPSAAECMTCHKKFGDAMPIGPKPQNLNANLIYEGTSQNQLQKLIDAGYLSGSFPPDLQPSVNWEDETASLETRARAYLDINCAHCHSLGGHCDYVNIRLNLSETDLYNVGVCMEPLSFVEGGPYVVNAGNAAASEMILRMNSNATDLMMPILGRSTIHEEGVQLISDWINSMEPNCE